MRQVLIQEIMNSRKNFEINDGVKKIDFELVNEMLGYFKID